jgi:uncharacterized protein YfdQ (DUF2303 family)
MDKNLNPNWKPDALDLTVVERLAVAALTPKQLAKNRQLAVLPDGYKLEEIPALHEAPLPDHIVQSVTLVELDSFIAYVKQFHTSTTRIFGEKTSHGAKFVGILNYHEGGNEGNAGRGTHVATYAPRFTEEFAAWLKGNGTQEQFLEHLRRWSYVVTSHTDADLIELASSLDFQTSGQFASKIERTQGGRKLLWNEEVDGSGQVKGSPVKVPEFVEVDAPVFLGGRQYQFKVDLLYRVASGRLTIGWEVQRSQKLLFDAVNELVGDVESGTGLEVFVGSVND